MALQRAVALDPKEFEAHWALGRALALKERYGDAVQSFQTAISLVPGRSDAHYQLGLALRRLGRTEEARDAYRRALALVHDDAERRLLQRKLGELDILGSSEGERS